MAVPCISTQMRACESVPSHAPPNPVLDWHLDAVIDCCTAALDDERRRAECVAPSRRPHAPRLSPLWAKASQQADLLLRTPSLESTDQSLRTGIRLLHAALNASTLGDLLLAQRRLNDRLDSAAVAETARSDGWLAELSLILDELIELALRLAGQPARFVWPMRLRATA